MPASRHTNVLCPLCSTCLSRLIDPDQALWRYSYFECSLCDRRFKRVDTIHRPKEWAWIAAGAILFTLAILIVTTLVVGRQFTCADVRFDGEYACADEAPVETWFDSGEARAIRLSLLFAAALPIPAAIAFFTVRYVWLLILPIGMVTGMVTGILVGEWAAHRWYPDMYWEFPGRAQIVVACMSCGASFICTVALISLEVAASQSSRFQLKRLPHDSRVWTVVRSA